MRDLTGSTSRERVSTPRDGPQRPGARRHVDARSRRVHLAKTVTWRFVATCTTVVISYLVTGSIAVGATIGGIEAATKMVLYYGHERAWARLTV